ncbi:MAG: hypothetical protein HY291_20575 [Planctomycetes bacterium]|nr:hypothetical protein [Planctomycetota bacterium]
MNPPETDSDGAAETPAASTASKQFPCKQCGAKVDFTPGTENLKCPYCGAENEIPASEEDIEELDFESAIAEAGAEEEQHEKLTVKCSACAAEISLEPNVTASTCPFCGANIVAESVSTKAFKPKSLLPFKLSKQQAFERFRDLVGKRWFAPNDLKQYAQTEQKLAGLYVPYWTYDSDTTSFYRGERGDDYTVTVGSGKDRHTETRTRWTSVSGTIWQNFDDILILASRSLPEKYAESLEPWDLEQLTPYRDEYLSGFRAESYQVDLKEGFDEARAIMDEAIRSAINKDIGGDHQRIHSVKTQYDNISFKHLLLPIWLSAYRYRDKVYRILINARTGEVQGERPYSWIKITLTVLAALAAIAAIVLIVQSKH